MMKTVTIITPTYNRAELLKKLYQSLEQQNNKDFEWLIVDDGSTDRTKEAVEEITDNATFHINYIWKENGGKHTAMNFSHNFYLVNKDVDVFLLFHITLSMR